MAWGETSDPLKFHQAYDWFSKRVPITKPTYLRMGLKWRRYAFTVAGVAQTQMVHTVWEQTLQSMRDGEHLKAYKRRISGILEKEWVGTVKDPPFRVQTIFRNAMQHSYNSGRYEMMTDPAILASRPFWVFDAILDEDTTDICIARDQIIRRHDDTFWQSNYPPLHHRCRSAVRTATKSEGEAAGVERTDTTEAGELPAQTGFGYRPDVGEWEPNVTQWPSTLRTVYAQKMKRMAQNLTPPLGATPEIKAIVKASKPPPVVHRPPDPLPPPPAKTKTLDQILMHEKIDDARGSNPGGIYRGEDGVERYIKIYDDEAQAYSEHLAGNVYRSLGLNAPETTVATLPGAPGEATRFILASKIVAKGEDLSKIGLTKARANRILDGFVADNLLGNWSVVGDDLSNIVWTGREAYRVDNGSALLMGVGNERKAEDLLSAIFEWEAFGDPTLNPGYARVFKVAGITHPEDIAERLLKQIDELEIVHGRVGGWQRYAPTLVTYADDRKIMGRMLDDRTAALTTVYRERLKTVIRDR